MERKVGMGGLGATIGVLVVWLTGEANFNVVNWTPEAAGALSALLGVLAGYFIPNPK